MFLIYSSSFLFVCLKVKKAKAPNNKAPNTPQLLKISPLLGRFFCELLRFFKPELPLLPKLLPLPEPLPVPLPFPLPSPESAGNLNLAGSLRLPSLSFAIAETNSFGCAKPIGISMINAPESLASLLPKTSPLPFSMTTSFPGVAIP